MSLTLNGGTVFRLLNIGSVDSSINHDVIRKIIVTGYLESLQLD